MKAFHEIFDTSNPGMVDHLIGLASASHAALQNLEAGIGSTPLQQADASFTFLNLIGFYPDTIYVDDVARPVKGRYLVEHANGVQFGITFLLADTDQETEPAPMFGNMCSDMSVTMMPLDVIANFIRLSFPTVVIQTTEGVSKTGVKVYHTTVRSEFKQPKVYHGFPVESGSAICSDETVALMQAFVRMLSMHLMGHKASNATQTLADILGPEEPVVASLTVAQEMAVAAHPQKDLIVREALAAARAEFLKSEGDNSINHAVREIVSDTFLNELDLK